MTKRLIDYLLRQGVARLRRPPPPRASIPNLYGMSARELESTHDYIQRLFPLPTKGPLNPDAPVMRYATLGLQVPLTVFSF